MIIPFQKGKQMDSDISNADSSLNVEFYLQKNETILDDDGVSQPDPNFGKHFIRINIPSDKTNIVDQPVREDHKKRFPRQWLYFQMKNGEQEVIGVPLSQWRKDEPEILSESFFEELSILKFQTVEQVATCSDMQMQRMGMSGMRLKERAKMFLIKNNSQSDSLEETKQELATLKAQMAILMEKKSVGGRPRKEA
tara:strand:+ start:301 stop:885 length:585 start_codon:yes stop_codon:yes gene_type:complete